jgi:hypothetical protein
MCARTHGPRQNRSRSAKIERRCPMTAREDVLARIGQAAPELRAHAVKELWLFGSAAREQLNADSDIDILVDFTAPVTLFEFARLRPPPGVVARSPRRFGHARCIEAAASGADPSRGRPCRLEIRPYASETSPKLSTGSSTTPPRTRSNPSRRPNGRRCRPAKS